VWRAEVPVPFRFLAGINFFLGLFFAMVGVFGD
jgi:hypothetical protein